MKRTWVICVLSVTGLWAANETTEIAKQRAASYGKLPLSFERNEGQADNSVRFLARGRGYGLFLTRREAVLSLAGSAKKKHAVLRMALGHASTSGADPVGVDGREGKSNYFVGKDPNQWHTGISQFAAVKYAGVYPGIDLVYHGNQGQLEYDFDVAPGADPRRIELRFQGAERLRINDAGDLVVSLGGSELVEHRPVVYQDAEGKRELVAGSYVLRGRDRIGFRLARYDRRRAVVIDPQLVYSTYLGSSEFDSGGDIAIDAAGNAYVTGYTSWIEFPVTPGAFQTGFRGNGDIYYGDAFVTKLNPTGSALLYSTYLGGFDGDGGSGIAVDSAGNAYVTGYTFSPEFPITPGAFQTEFACCGNFYEAAFVTKLNATGSALLYSTYLGGSDGNYGNTITLDAAGNAYVAGDTGSEDFPVTPGAFQTSYGGGYVDAFVSKLNPSGSALLYSTYLGGSDGDSARSIAIDAAGNAYVSGFAGSNFPVTPGAFQTSYGGGGNSSYGGDAFITKLNPSGSALLYSTYLGGSGADGAYSIAIDAAGNAYVSGFAGSGFPVTPGAFQTSYVGGSGGFSYDGFVTKLNPSGSALLYSTYLSGICEDIAIDATGKAYVTGFTSLTNFPVTPGAFQTSGFGAFVTKFNAAGSMLLYSTLLGGSDSSGGNSIAIDTAGNAYVTGNTYSTDFPVTPGAFQTSSAGDSDAFVAKLDTTQVGPVITLVGVLPGPPKQVQFHSQDQQSGLASIQVLRCSNCTAMTDSFAPGIKDPVMTTATKTDQTMSSAVQIEATDLNGNTTIFDPTDITIQADGHAEVQLVRISGLEHVVMISNGTPGVRAVVLRVRGKDVPVFALKGGETRTIDIAAELKPGRDNEVTVLSWGRRGTSASVVFTQP